MRKALIIVIVLVVAAGGYLGWDWHAKTKKQALEPGITLYYWTDAKGNKNFSDSPPPADARNIQTEKGYKHIQPPLVVMIKNKAIALYKATRDKLFKPGKKSKKSTSLRPISPLKDTNWPASINRLYPGGESE